ncbi:hypothetical protein GLOTRDRAFT_69896 [Gloeophyllum trabeum ATCC 11539]|uniref:C2H2-type domain-containing protein n=1 Tax=Gloeophyllum trabeum (strain ATCC 11539 / FP-39264 / Madison 617) TaxID=670483 RepID=S7QI41_GLOTA|nr:uncharacterized protein GLOTRDRAFT_69896 [Gloeophyllum trabeum ATCC 11539]EPQ58893.1 hypothetical protein GLOTRDRAFT_69896 [Gloeophyllum trabeum ATCC 11539]
MDNDGAQVLPSPEVVEDAIASTSVDTDALLSLISSVPPKTLHAYTLKRIPASEPSIVSSLHTFFSELTPPPLLHCVRCHKDYTEVENDDRSCLIAHDDDSAEVERVGAKGKGRAAAGTGGYETLWGCCGKTVEGDGDMGPPDGWCYEGKHTTDIKRARFRADSTPTDDKLISCYKLNCHGIRSQLPRASTPTSSPRSRIADNYSPGRLRKRRRSTRDKEDQEMRSASDAESDGTNDSLAGELREKEGSAAGSVVDKSKGKAKPSSDQPKRKPGRPRKKKDEDMDIDSDAASVKSHKSVRKPRPKALAQTKEQGTKSDNEDAMSVVSTSSAKPNVKSVKGSMKPRSRAAPSKSKLGQDATVVMAVNEEAPQRKKTKTT